MFIVCILFLLAVHRLVLIVNSWDAFGRGGEEEREGRFVPILLKQCFCSGLMNPSVFVFVLFVFFPELEELKRGFFFCCFVFLQSFEGREELRTMTKRKITFPLEEKN